MRKQLKQVVGLTDTETSWHENKRAKFDHFSYSGLNHYQADLVSLPETNDEYKYIFVIVNNGTLFVDAEPQINKDAQTTSNSLRKINSRLGQTLKYPIHILYTDHGSEFYNKTFRDTCKDLDITLRFASVANKNQMSKVENAIGLITKPLYLMINDSMRRGFKDAINWIPKLNEIVNAINRIRHETFNETANLQKEFNRDNIKVQDILHSYVIGSKVHPKLPRPLHPITDEKLYGNFRSGDLRFNPNYEAEITDVIYRHGHEPRYELKLTSRARDKNPESTLYQGFKSTYKKDQLRLTDRGNYMNVKQYLNSI